MTSGDLLLQGVELMLFGMGFVFVFLIVLIYCVRLMSFVVGRLEPAPAVAAAPAAANGVDDDTITAIRIALQRHRARRG
ncbi:OadG family protein [Stutzerimonas tarimensis]|uniref:Probable oxaloacetate decarboxylase gamma chain n=1 Tax=Stutzerimonas tarimensis TaxID=1507735 RepID=A0ABV7SZ15_9GAMM